MIAAQIPGRKLIFLFSENSELCGHVTNISELGLFVVSQAIIFGKTQKMYYRYFTCLPYDIPQ